jgi:hypothetical protein
LSVIRPKLDKTKRSVRHAKIHHHISTRILFHRPLWRHRGAGITYQIDGQPYEGYYITPFEQAPLVLLIHDWDGLTDYEIIRANMLADLGYAVFAMDLFGAGVRPTEVTGKRQHTGELYKNRQKMRALMNGALEAAREKGANVENAVVMGYGITKARTKSRGGDSSIFSRTR